MATKTKLAIDVYECTAGDRRLIVVRHGAEEIFRDKIDLNAAGSRKRLWKALERFGKEAPVPTMLPRLIAAAMEVDGDPTQLRVTRSASGPRPPITVEVELD